MRDKDKTYTLIGLLESSSELWNSTLKGCKDTEQKAKCIEIISKSLKISTTDVNRK